MSITFLGFINALRNSIWVQFHKIILLLDVTDYLQCDKNTNNVTIYVMLLGEIILISLMIYLHCQIKKMGTERYNRGHDIEIQLCQRKANIF